ncbi:MAG: NAD-dependent isocitrate dehydrogenase [Bdellovibrionales bacterium]|nr:NAD-dependent isocitrate dehydrogenase [Bdellovibrionales bacterium]
MTQTTVTLIRGDGIGPEICDAVVEILAAAKANIRWEEVEAGLGAIERHGSGITEAGLATLARNKVALKGPTTTPVGGGHKSINVTIRKALDLYVNVRPILTLPAVETPFKNVNMIIVRENIEDTYGGIEHMQSPDLAQGLRLITRSGSMRAHRYAFELARREHRKKVTCGHKANIMKITDGLWLECFREVAKEYPDIEANDIIVDNCCMQMVTKPQQFDILVLPNLFGDIVSDLGAGLVGGLGVASGANIGTNCAVFEPVHGSAPDIAGKGLANPTAIVCSAVSMLRHMGKLDVANRVENALMRVLAQPVCRTRDLCGMASTQDFTKAIVKELA